jgi:hypothetical protein
MKSTRLACSLLLLGSASLLSGAEATEGLPPNAIALSNGHDLAGWRLYLDGGKTEASAATVSTEGVIHLASKLSGYLVTEKKYSNYHLHVEWRWPKDAPANANSGVMVHLNPPDAIWPAAFECQLKTGNAGQVVGMGLDIPAAPMVTNRKRAPRLADPSEKPLGEWNAYEIYCRGKSIEVFVNGVRQNEVSDLPVSEGGIALQLEGFPIEFRNVWLAPLPGS